MFRSPSSSSSSSSGWARHQRCMCFNLIILVIISNLMVDGNAWSWTYLERRSRTTIIARQLPSLFRCEDDNENSKLHRRIKDSSSPPWLNNVRNWIGNNHNHNNRQQELSSEHYDTHHGDKLPGEIRIRRALPSGNNLNMTLGCFCFLSLSQNPSMLTHTLLSFSLSFQMSE